MVCNSSASRNRPSVVWVGYRWPASRSVDMQSGTKTAKLPSHLQREPVPVQAGNFHQQEATRYHSLCSKGQGRLSQGQDKPTRSPRNCLVLGTIQEVLHRKSPHPQHPLSAWPPKEDSTFLPQCPSSALYWQSLITHQLQRRYAYKTQLQNTGFRAKQAKGWIWSWQQYLDNWNTVKTILFMCLYLYVHHTKWICKSTPQVSKP